MRFYLLQKYIYSNSSNFFLIIVLIFFFNETKLYEKLLKKNISKISIDKFIIGTYQNVVKR